MSDLRTTLVEAYLPRPVTPEVRALRQRLCEFIRRNEARMFDVSDPRAGRVRAMLGWDDETMSAFIDSPLLCHSSPHAAMNSFPPMLAFPWMLGRAAALAEQKHGAPAVHFRTQCTHHDFNDTFAKPHAWWHRGLDGSIVKTHLFPRVKMKYHPILSKPVPDLGATPIHELDRAAVELASLATTYAGFCVIYRNHLERVCGFHGDGRLFEVPIDLLNRFTIEDVGLLGWFDRIERAGMHLRLVVPDAPMRQLTREEAERIAERAVPWPEQAIIAPNMVNFTQFYRFGLSLMFGGRAMAAYVPDMNEKIGAFSTQLEGWSCLAPAFVPFTHIPFVDVLGIQTEAELCQKEYGIATSLPLVASAFGPEVGTALEVLLDSAYEDVLYDATLIKA
jgi:hypothetical protein